MRGRIVADSQLRLLETTEYQAFRRELRARRRELWQVVAARYAARFTEAGFFERLLIRYLRHREFQQELRKIAASCWASHLIIQRGNAAPCAVANDGPVASVDNSSAPGGMPPVISHVGPLRTMIVTYPAERTVSVWIGTFKSEKDFDRCVDKSVSPALALYIDIASICEVGFERQPVAVRDLLDGFSGSDSFIERAVSAAAVHELSTANAALVCYYVRCSDAPADWGGLRFLGSFSGLDVV